MLYALSGTARCGKDSFSALLVSILSAQGQASATWAFADQLKRELEPTIWAKYHISVWTQDSAEKAIIRPDLVSHGEKRRAESGGRYWIEQIDPAVRAGLTAGVSQIVKDCRYASHDADEAAWVHSLGGKIIHITRILPDGMTPIGPANPQEALNDPKVYEVADVRLTWPSAPLDELMPYVHNVLAQIKARASSSVNSIKRHA